MSEREGDGEIVALVSYIEGGWEDICVFNSTYNIFHSVIH